MFDSTTILICFTIVITVSIIAYTIVVCTRYQNGDFNLSRKKLNSLQDDILRLTHELANHVNKKEH